MPASHEIPQRKDVPAKDRWNLSRLFASEAAWEEGLKDYEAKTSKIAGFKGSPGKNAESFLATLAFYAEISLLEERLGVYADLRQTEDEGDNDSRGRNARFVMAATKAQGEWAWFVPEIQTLADSFVEKCLADPRFADYAVFLRKIRRFKPHILSENEERLLALQIESNQTPQEGFSVLTNVDIDFGMVDTPQGTRPLSQSTFSSFMQNPDREIRRKAYLQFYKAYDSHKNTIATLYAGSVKLDKYKAQVRKFPNARSQALFPDDVPEAVYDNLVSTVNANLGVLHSYYDLRKKALKLDSLRHYDVYVPLVPQAKVEHSYDEAVELVHAALAPLGEEYVSTLRKGLTSGWVDRYENKGKRSGAFSAGSFAGDPYILLNYKSDVLRDVFTMAHEGGHSMHSWYSASSNPFSCYNYTIFEAEVASTFNEQLLFRYMYERAESDEVRASLLANKVDDVLATLFRQTMFAEFEKRSHEMLESGEPLTVESLRSEYRKLLVKYFGPAMQFEEESDLEGLRIPHFYNAFYVYKYATGISASIALSKRVLGGGAKEREDYFRFLRSGGSRFPIEALKVAGVDMSTPAPVEAACAEFAGNVAELKRLLKL
jgi:oligoendopeptidase F